MNRRRFLGSTIGAAANAVFAASTGSGRTVNSLVDEIGITTGSFTRHLAAERAPGKLRLLDLPRLMRDELDLRVIDLMTATLVDLSPGYLDALRAAAANAGCVLTNLKMNQPGLDLGHPDSAVRRHAIKRYKLIMDAAARLGVRWVRPLPAAKRPDYALLAAALRELIAYGAERGLGVLIENFGWLADDPEAIPAIIQANCERSPTRGTGPTRRVSRDSRRHFRLQSPAISKCSNSMCTASTRGTISAGAFRQAGTPASADRGASSISTRTCANLSGRWASCGTKFGGGRMRRKRDENVARARIARPGTVSILVRRYAL